MATDSLVAWRLYIVWSRNKRILIVPVIALCAGATGGTAIVVVDILTCIHGYTQQLSNIYDALTIALFAADIVVNWFCTIMIIGRLWWVTRRLGGTVDPGRAGWKRYGRIIRALVESGFIYSFVMGAFMVSIAVQSVSQKAYQSGT